MKSVGPIGFPASSFSLAGETGVTLVGSGETGAAPCGGQGKKTLPLVGSGEMGVAPYGVRGKQALWGSGGSGDRYCPL